MSLKYLVSYSWSSASGSGFGNIEIDASNRISSITSVRKVEEVIREKCEPNTSVVALNFFLLDEHGAPT